MITQWNDFEDEALHGLPLRAQIIYLRGLRRYMNYKTGVVGGIERRISLKMLGELTHEEFNRQLQKAPSKDAVRASLEQLKRVGLIERVEDEDYLVFFLKKADTGVSVQINNPTTTPQQPHRDSHTTETNNGEALTYNNTTTTPHPIPVDNPTHRITDNNKKITTNVVVKSPPEFSTLDENVIDIETKRNPSIPYQDIVAAYHEILPCLSQVYKLTEDRKKKIKKLWLDELEDLKSWQNYFRHIARSDFLTGKVTGVNGRVFTASFDFIINPTNFIKIAEDKYHGKKIQR